MAAVTARTSGSRPGCQRPSLPSRVTIWEVGPRDGLQNEQTIVPVEVKLEFLDRLAEAGLTTHRGDQFRPPHMGATARGRRGPARRAEPPRRRPLSGAGAERAGTRPRAGGRCPADRGIRQRHGDLRQAQPEPHARRAVRHVRAGGVAGARQVSTSAATCPCASATRGRACSPAAGRPVGPRLLALGCSQLSLGDTIGVATPGQVRPCSPRSPRPVVGPSARRALPRHLRPGALQHLAALRHGVSTVDSSAGGLGGCPYAESATGNLATEDLVWMLDGLGIDTGVDLDALVATERLDGGEARQAESVQSGQGTAGLTWSSSSATAGRRRCCPAARRSTCARRAGSHRVPARPSRESYRLDNGSADLVLQQVRGSAPATYDSVSTTYDSASKRYDCTPPCRRSWRTGPMIAISGWSRSRSMRRIMSVSSIVASLLRSRTNGAPLCKASANAKIVPAGIAEVCLAADKLVGPSASPRACRDLSDD